MYCSVPHYASQHALQGVCVQRDGTHDHEPTSGETLQNIYVIWKSVIIGLMCCCNTLLVHGVVQISETVILYSTGPEELPVQYSNSRGSQDTHGDGPQLYRHPQESI